MSRSNRYFPEFRERAIHMLLEQQGQYASQWAAINSIVGSKVGCTAESLCKWSWQLESNHRKSEGLSNSARERLSEI